MHCIAAFRSVVLGLFVFSFASGTGPAQAAALALSGGATTQMLWVDLDSDGYPDLIRFVPGGAAQVLLNDRDGGFEEAAEFALPVPLYSAEARDLNADGAPELLLGGASHAYVVGLTGEAPTLLHRIASGGAVEVTDYDLDGVPDLVVGGRLFRRDGAEFAAVELPELVPAPEDAIANPGDESTSAERAAALPDGVVRESHLADRSVSAAKIADGAVSPRHLSPEVRGMGDVISSTQANGRALRTPGDGSGEKGDGGAVVVGADDARGVSGDLVVTGDLRVHGTGSSSFDGSVGVGTPSPANPLDVEGSGTDTGGIPSAGHVVARVKNARSNLSTALSIDAHADRRSALYFSEEGTAQWGLQRNPGASGELQVIQYDPDSQIARMRITEEGRVGIGNSVPATPLDVVGPGTDAGGAPGQDHVVARFHNPDGVVSAISVDANPDGRSMLFLGEGGEATWAIANMPLTEERSDLYIGVADFQEDDVFLPVIAIPNAETFPGAGYSNIVINADLILDPKDYERNIWLYDGSMAIGTASPANPLHVEKEGTDAGGLPGEDRVVARFRNPDDTSGTAISVDRAGYEGDSEIFFAQDGEARWGVGTDKDPFGFETFRIGPVSDGFVQDYFRVGLDGQVGVGKPSSLFSFPFNALDVWGDGSSVGGISGHDQVVARFKNNLAGTESAIAVDAEPGLDTRLYLSSAGAAKWSIGNRVGQGNQLEFSWVDPASGTIVPAITVDKIGSEGTDSVFVKIGHGTGVPKNTLDVKGIGTDVGGVSGEPTVVARIQNTISDESTALAINSTGDNSEVFFNRNGNLKWRMGSDIHEESGRNVFRIMRPQEGILEGFEYPAIEIDYLNHNDFLIPMVGMGTGPLNSGEELPAFPLHVRNGWMNDAHDAVAGFEGVIATEGGIKFSDFEEGEDYWWMSGDEDGFILFDWSEGEEGPVATFTREVVIFSPEETWVQKLRVLGGADLVEDFDAGGTELEPGSVVVFDPDDPGTIAASTRPYDRRVAGIVSGAGGLDPGLHLGSETEISGDTPVAMAGRVYVRCSAENGPVGPGDLLTTSSSPGVAMRATDRDRAPGAVVGKAMGTLEDGEGLVLALVALQ